MSGVYIPGMKMPETCGECPFVMDADDVAPSQCGRTDFTLRDGIVDPFGKPEWCDLYDVPDHGRLIDAEAFREEMDKHYPFDKFTQSKHGEADVAKGTILLMLADAPTIIPADKEE